MSEKHFFNRMRSCLKSSSQSRHLIHPGYIKHSPRGPIDLAIVNITVLMTMEQDHQLCRDAKIVLGAVSPTPLRARKAENVLKGKKIDGALIDRAAQVASDEAHPRQGSIRGSFEYKKEMVRVLTGRAIKEIIAS